ncbi:hypothetical protein J3R80_14255 [Aliiroseovarius sp. Z3]|uniref:DUF2946 family protein n=1 Tax=Aliiroseovarius sp. Z3 TaxID=2811402 RepID=UPI0023B26B08|nr:DUF2946 family protein [Aliiroseovarius sp. Z3]MDE9451634.1 hypothetical protein [Aliiroseovarius sp. Z3]
MRRVWQMSAIIAGAVRRTAGNAALTASLLALVLQLFTSSMGYASNGTWIEICSDFGTEYVQVDLSDPSLPVPDDCHDCFDCVMCAASMAALVDNRQPQLAPSHVAAQIVLLNPQTLGVALRRAWPETRGPPAANKKTADRAARAFMASIQENGGAL